MATIEDYVSGKVCQQIAKSFSIFGAAGKSSLAGTRIGDIMQENVRKLAPKKLTIDEAAQVDSERPAMRRRAAGLQGGAHGSAVHGLGFPG